MAMSVHLIYELNLLDEVKRDAPHFIESMRTVHAIVGKYKTEIDSVAAARELTLSSTSTRTKPNAFNYRHQLERMVALGENREKIIEEWSNPKASERLRFQHCALLFVCPATCVSAGSNCCRPHCL